MKISPVNYQYAFKSAPKKQEEVHVFAYDDEISQNRRAKMREDILSKSIPYWEEHDEHTLEEKPLELLIRSLTGVKDFLTKPKKEKPITTNNSDDNVSKPQLEAKAPVDGSSIYYMDVYNFSEIQEGKTFRGSMVTKKDEIEALKNANITAIIDLRGYDNLKEKGVDGINFLSVNFNRMKDSKIGAFKKIDSRKKEYLNWGMSESEIEEYLKVNKELHYKQSRDDIKQMIDFVNLINTENCYMGCEYGKYVTDFAVLLNNIINPKTQLFAPNHKYTTYAPLFINLLNNLNDEEKEKLGITDEFFQKKMKFLEQL